MEKVYTIVQHVIERVDFLLHTFLGWVCALGIVFLNYIAGHEFAVCLMAFISKRACLVRYRLIRLSWQYWIYTDLRSIPSTGNTTRVTSEWTAGKSIPSPHGDPVGSTDANCLLAQKCAIMAIKNPFEVTDMSYIINPTYKQQQL